MSKDDSQNIFFKLLLLFGGLWLLKKILSQPTHTPGISGIPYSRSLIPYESENGNKVFEKELSKFSNKDIGDIIRLIIEVRQKQDLSYPIYKSFSNANISGEFRKGQIRILVYQLNDRDFLMLSVFKKKTNETPKQELEKAERRLSEYKQRFRI